MKKSKVEVIKKEDVIKEKFAKISQPGKCLFCYPIDDCMNCPITISEMKQLTSRK